ncbi:ABC transporter ATP-binding protein [Neorhizobium sp. NCHU2750]|uniref:ABC transporter ATP-binding protein n=1 Tax=Neorhizobium sp. NCHU2750 TaxID=1825976 RepID=UPI000E748930|nr:ABC transporter ATP-binding protein [Neorhizobium sp. NCHU2750]
MPASDKTSEKPDYLASLRLLSGHIAARGKAGFVAALITATASAFLELVPVWSICQLVTAILDGTADIDLFLLHSTLSAAAIIVGYGLFAYSTILAHIAAFDAIHRLRLQLSQHIARLPLGYFSGRSSAEAKRLVVDEPEKLESVFAHGLPDGVSALSTWIAVSAWLFIADWQLAIAAVFVTPLSFLLLGRAMTVSGRLAGTYMAVGARMNADIADYLAGMQVLKVFNRSGPALGVATRAIDDYAQVQADMTRLYLPLGGPFFTLVLTNIVFILPTGLLLFQAGQTDLPTLVLFLILGANYSQPLLKLFNQFHHLAHLSVGSRLVADILAEPQQADSGTICPLGGHDIRFENVSFSYPDREVLQGIDLIARAGEMTALVGPSGAGKSTLASLVARMRDVSAGRILIGGVDLRDMALEQLMQTVAFVFQDTFLFSDTIEANLRVGKADASREEIEQAASAAMAHDFIVALPQGYSTRIGSGGTQLSGGERQRLAIARAILKNAPIIILDEATAMTDPDNEAAIQDAIRSLAKGKTLLVVAHRLHTIMHAQQIVVLRDGTVAESGRHEQLLQQSGLYASLWQSYSQA